MSKFRGSYSGEGKMLCAPWMQAAMLARAERGKVFAESIAPVDETGPHPGLYKESFSVSSGIRPRSGGRTRRAYGRLTNSADYAIDVEFGSDESEGHGATPRYRVLGRSLDAMKG